MTEAAQQTPRYIALTRWGDLYNRPIVGHHVEVYRIEGGRLTGVARWHQTFESGGEAHAAAAVMNRRFERPDTAAGELQARKMRVTRFGVLVAGYGGAVPRPPNPLNGVMEPFRTQITALLADEDWSKHPGFVLSTKHSAAQLSAAAP